MLAQNHAAEPKWHVLTFLHPILFRQDTQTEHKWRLLLLDLEFLTRSVRAPKQKSENSRLPTCSNFAHCMHADHQIFLSWLPIPKWVTTQSTQMVSLCVDKKQQTLCCCCCCCFFFISFLLLCLQVKRLRLWIICTSDDGYISGS
jgi:hypothetical protein